ncbi:MAG: ABC transporter permease [Culturomica sp.]|jgi:hypothetical protein|nr:ABC transporter permease [Culturomica sp.]
MNLIRKLLRSHLSIAQLTGFFVANLTGMVIVLLCVQVYADLRPLFGGEDGLMRNNYLIVTKKVSTLGMLSGRNSLFSPEELEEIRRQPFIKKAGVFDASRFKVAAGIAFQNIGFSTEMFFESVPDEYLDVQSPEWHFTPGGKTIPIILPRNYLDLYNFGFAQARNLPKMSEGVISLMRLDIRLSGEGRQGEFTGKIVGFSNRLNTILVPDDFIKWANQTYASHTKPASSRIILETNLSGDAEAERFLKANGYETDQEKLEAGKAVGMLNRITFVTGAVGMVICVLSVYILMLSIYLLLQKNSTKLENLLLIGYSVSQVSSPYRLLTWTLNMTVLLLSVAAVLYLRSLYIPWLTESWPDFKPVSVSGMLLTAAGLCLTVSLLNGFVIGCKIRKLS